MKKILLSGSVFLLVILAGCSDPSKETVATSVAMPMPAPTEADLMVAVFGKEYEAKKDGVLLRDPESKSPMYWVTASAFTALPNNEALLLTNWMPTDEESPEDFLGASNGTKGEVSLYALRWEENRWKVLRRHEQFDEGGMNGHSGEAKWVKLGRDGIGLAIEDAWMGRGVVGSWLSLYDVSGGKIRKLTKNGINIQSSHECRPTLELCGDIEAEWTIEPRQENAEYGDLVLRLSGELKQLSRAGESLSESEEEVPQQEEAVAGQEEDDLPRDVRKIKETARYRFVNGHYALIEGKNVGVQLYSAEGE